VGGAEIKPLRGTPAAFGNNDSQPRDAFCPDNNSQNATLEKRQWSEIGQKRKSQSKKHAK
jgi:hypothetical protein